MLQTFTYVKLVNLALLLFTSDQKQKATFLIDFILKSFQSLLLNECIFIFEITIWLLLFYLRSATGRNIFHPAILPVSR